MGSRYRKGHRWELKIKKMWEEKGYVVYRSAGSKGAADLIALKDGKIVLIQVKVNKKPKTQRSFEVEKGSEEVQSHTFACLVE